MIITSPSCCASTCPISRTAMPPPWIQSKVKKTALCFRSQMVICEKLDCHWLSTQIAQCRVRLYGAVDTHYRQVIARRQVSN